jgi:hypothetical protein
MEMNPMQAQGTGTVLENQIVALLQTKGYISLAVPKKERLAAFISAAGRKIYIQQAHLGNGIYGTDIYTDFILNVPSLAISQLIIECKWQQSSGSVDEKFPYLSLNIQHNYPYSTIVVLDGNGYKPGAEAWLKAQVGINPNLIAVYSLMQFLSWGNAHL